MNGLKWKSDPMRGYQLRSSDRIVLREQREDAVSLCMIHCVALSADHDATQVVRQVLLSTCVCGDLIESSQQGHAGHVQLAAIS